MKAGFAEMRQKMADARPEVLICIGNDHLNQLFMDNMPAFIVGKGPTADGTWAWERRMGVPDYSAKVDVALAMLKPLGHPSYET